VQGLVTQCTKLEIPFLDALDPPYVDAQHLALDGLPANLWDIYRAQVDAAFDLILDGIFGFSFEGSIRAPFDSIIATLRECSAPIVSIDIPSGWHVETGNAHGVGLEPTMLVSLTAPKPCAAFFTGGDRVHYVGGRFVPPSVILYLIMLWRVGKITNVCAVPDRSPRNSAWSCRRIRTWTSACAWNCEWRKRWSI
jgi:hypothetical protein